ncbi:Uncharacterised protein [uncultured archaeon]|nr:Uncharacterised protein [uncultured archaeon]
MSQHPNVHHAWQDWSNEETLHVAVAYSNPFRWETRRRLLHDFRHHMKNQPNVKLYVGELAYGNRPFEVTGEHAGDAQFRTDSELFHKENILNKVIERFNGDWKYGAYVDADFTFTRHDWALETIHQLQHHDFVQPFSTYTNLTAKVLGGSRPGGVARGFAATYIENGYQVPQNPSHREGGWPTGAGIPYGTKWNPPGATGGAWAFTRDAFNTVGGLMDQCILGHADWFMTFGLVQETVQGMHDNRYHPAYAKHILAWQDKAKLLKKNIGYVDQYAVHHYHGSLKNRGYESRDGILVKYQFDPVHDLRTNWQGIYELAGNKPGLRDAIRQYFKHRSEDSTE